MEIYIADVRAFADEHALLEKWNLLTQERREQMVRLRNFADKQRCVCAGLLLEYGLNKRGFTLRTDLDDKAHVHLAEGVHGKPYLVDAKDLHFNLSHSGDYVAAVFADCEAGIDVERIREAKPKVADRFFAEDECAHLQTQLMAHGTGEKFDWEFIKLWTRKESYIKAVGEGMHLPLASFSVLSDTVAGDELYYLKTWDYPKEYALSVCAKQVIGADITMVDLSKMI